ncbi:hypothetical protein BN903_4 [Halorubrum sp. AJ67]|nr:hypothetical protein BN903_4 [Halorubrum sp. AJ67]
MRWRAPPSALLRARGAPREGVGGPKRSGGPATRLGRREVLCGRVGLEGAAGRRAEAFTRAKLS